MAGGADEFLPPLLFFGETQTGTAPRSILRCPY
jgi:hypothetical protein